MLEPNDGASVHPLLGKRIMITRAKTQSAEMVRLIESLGGEAYEFPVIQIGPPSNWGPVDAAIRELASYDWLIFTSANGVDYFFLRMRELANRQQAAGSMGITAKIAAVGTKTAEALRTKGVHVDLLPQEFVAESLADELRSQVQPGQRILLPRADIARKLLPDALRELGCEVTEIDVYENRPCSDNRQEAVRMLRNGEIHAIAFTSSSTVRSFVTIMEGEDLSRLLDGVLIACIGPVAAETAEQLGLPVHVTAKPHTVQGLLHTLADYIKE